MKVFELPSTKKKLSVSFAGQWSSDMIHTEGLRVRQVPGSIPGCPPFPFNFKVRFQETS